MYEWMNQSSKQATGATVYLKETWESLQEEQQKEQEVKAGKHELIRA